MNQTPPADSGDGHREHGAADSAPDTEHLTEPVTTPFAAQQQPYPPGQNHQPWAHGPMTSPYPTSHGAPSHVAGHPSVGTPDRPRAGVTKPIVVTALLAGLLGGVVGVGGSALLNNDDSGSVPVLSSAPDTANNAADVKPGSVTYAAQIASKSTADIKVAGAQGSAVGSGIVLSPDGYVLTNNHVVAMAGNGSTIQVTTSDGKTYGAEVTGTSPSYDLAVIKLDGASGLTPAALGDSDGLQVGEQVVAVGSPENLYNALTIPEVTAADESGSGVTVYNGLQTDTPINPGNSGGPLVNLKGQVVGVNSAVDTGQAASGGVQAYGLGFAIPVNTAKRIGNELLQDGQATKPVLGVSGSLTATDSAAEGAQISSVQSGGAADQAGIKQGDVITKIGDTPISNYADLMAQILTHTPGETVSVTVGSGSDARTVQVKLGSAVDKQETTIPESGGQSNQPRIPFGGGGFGGLVP